MADLTEDDGFSIATDDVKDDVNYRGREHGATDSADVTDDVYDMEHGMPLGSNAAARESLARAAADQVGSGRQNPYM